MLGRLMKRFFCAVVLIALCGQTSFAEEVVQNEKAHDWSGPYIGLQGSFGALTRSDYLNNVIQSYGSDTSYSRDYRDAGVYIGYRKQIDKTVLGLELSRNNGSTERETINGSLFYADTTTSNQLTVSVGHAFDTLLISVSAGKVYSDTTMDGDPFGLGVISYTSTYGSLNLEKSLKNNILIGGSYKVIDTPRVAWSRSKPNSTDQMNHSFSIRLGYQF
jgi:opacity protein-like surface antigen